MDHAEPIFESDVAVPARYLLLRSIFQDRLLARVEELVLARYRVQPTRRVSGSLLQVVRTGFQRPVEGEFWPVVFLSAVDIHLALCVQIGEERLSALGTMINGPQRVRHRSWEGWWGWESSLGELGPQFFSLPAAEQEDVMQTWYADKLEWLAHAGLLMRT